MFSLELSQARAKERLGRTKSDSGRTRRPRSDRGALRCAPEVVDFLRERCLAHERPHLPSLLGELAAYCREGRLRCPSRASVYTMLDRLDGHTYRMAELPPAVREALYNLGPDAIVPGHQVAFYCFNYGDLSAVCFASGMPWLDLRHAARLGGWRPKSRGLLEAACRVRRI